MSSDIHEDNNIENNNILTNAFINASPELEDDDVTKKLNDDSRPNRPKPPSLPPPNLTEPGDVSESREITEQKIPMVPIGPPPSYIPTHHDSNDEDEDEEDDDDDLDETEDYSEQIHKKKSGILFHKNSVRDPDRVPKQVTFGKLPRRHGDDPDPCLLIILFVVFLIAVVGMVLVCLVIKGVLKVPDKNCDSNNSQQNNVCLLSQLSACPFGWVLYEKSCYGIPLLETRNYSQARNVCFQHGSYPVSLETKRENDWFLNNIKRQRDFLYQNDNPLFIGIRPASIMTWESTKQFEFENNLHESFVANSCYSLYSNGTWQPTSCEMELTFYCERAKFQIP